MKTRKIKITVTDDQGILLDSVEVEIDVKVSELQIKTLTPHGRSIEIAQLSIGQG